MERSYREAIEREGVPYILTALMDCIEDIELDNIIMVTDYKTQIRGIDYAIKGDNKELVYIDSKFHLNNSNSSIMPIEVTKFNGLQGWGIDTTLSTDYILDLTKNYGYYVLDCHKLHSFMLQHLNKYPSIYNRHGEEGKKHTKAVPIQNLIEAEVIIYQKRWDDTMAINKKNIEASAYYKNYIEPKLNKLVHSSMSA